MKIDDWPDCPTDGCSNKVCTWANAGLCHPCSVALHGESIIEFMYEATHDDEGRLITGDVWIADCVIHDNCSPR
jgi:hypothetical protein